MTHEPTNRLRSVVSWVTLGLGVLWTALGVVEMFTADPNEGEGWGGGVVIVLLVALPLLAVGWAVRSEEPRVVRRTAIAAAVLFLLVAFVLVMQILDPIEDELRAVLTQLPAMAAYLAAFVVEIRALRAAGRDPQVTPSSSSRR